MIEVKFKSYENKVTRGLAVMARKMVKRSLGVANKNFKHNIGLRDHSLEDLAKLDHPYARRHGPTGSPLHEPYWMVHKQTGELASTGVMEPISIETSDAVTGNFGFKMGDKAIYIVAGTSKMIPRPVVWGSLVQVRGAVYAIFREEFNKRFKGSQNVGLKSMMARR